MNYSKLFNYNIALSADSNKSELFVMLERILSKGELKNLPILHRHNDINIHLSQIKEKCDSMGLLENEKFLTLKSSLHEDIY